MKREKHTDSRHVLLRYQKRSLEEFIIFTICNKGNSEQKGGNRGGKKRKKFHNTEILFYFRAKGKIALK